MKESTRTIVFVLLIISWIIWGFGLLVLFLGIFNNSMLIGCFLAVLVGGSISLYIFTAFYRSLEYIEELHKENEQLKAQINTLSDEVDSLDNRLTKTTTK